MACTATVGLLEDRRPQFTALISCLVLLLRGLSGAAEGKVRPLHAKQETRGHVGEEESRLGFVKQERAPTRCPPVCICPMPLQVCMSCIGGRGG